MWLERELTVIYGFARLLFELFGFLELGPDSLRFGNSRQPHG
jgi:hypothetical protein